MDEQESVAVSEREQQGKERACGKGHKKLGIFTIERKIFQLKEKIAEIAEGQPRGAALDRRSAIFIAGIGLFSLRISFSHFSAIWHTVLFPDTMFCRLHRFVRRAGYPSQNSRRLCSLVLCTNQ